MCTGRHLYAQADIADDVVLVTGATSGIGEACAWRFAEAGCKLVLTGRRAARLDSLKASIEAKYEGVSVTCVTMDVTDLERVAALPGALLPLEVDILVNNAGLALGVAPAEANSMAHMQQMMATNVTALIAMSAAFLPGMKARGKGHLINIGSIAGHEAYAGGSGYCASKAAVAAFTTAARHDLVGTPVRVSCISPGAVNTEFSTVRLGNKGDADKVYDNLEPLVAADVADNVLYAATRPKHVQIADIVVFCTNQASAKNVARVGPSLGGPSS